jgi:hypothetical protein
VRPRDPIHALRRALRLTIVVLGALLLFAPIWLGPATGIAVRALGGADEHRCACGMKAGKCACPECARLEAQSHDDDGPRLPVLKSTCDDGGQVPLSASLPLAAVPIGSMLPARERARLPNAWRAEPDPSLAGARPPIPPPRATFG